METTMKNKNRFALIVAAIIVYGSTLSAQIKVPDVKFRTTLASSYGIVFDGNNNITNPVTAAAVTVMNVSFEGISDLTGIEAFTGLTELHCANNLLVHLDLSANTDLTYLDCHNNQLTSLNVKSNLLLVYLNCFNNKLADIVLTENTALTLLSCEKNLLSALDISANSALTELYCDRNKLTNLDISANIALTYLSCYNNQLTSLDISQNTVLNNLDISGNITPFTLTVKTELFPTEDYQYFADTEPASIKITAVLPVKLISFYLINEKLVWKTATETNNLGWEIENRIQEKVNVSPDKGWGKIGFVSGKGTTVEIQTYSFTPQNHEKYPQIQYRLKQIDLDGNFSYSNVLTVKMKPENSSLAQNYPNPFNPSTLISFQLKTGSFVSLVVYDLLGREVRTLVSGNIPEGSYNIRFMAADLPSGIYFYKLTADNYSTTKSMILIK